jgi:hypothetical protein
MLRALAYLVVALTAFTACDEKRMGRTPETKAPLPVPYESHYAPVQSVHLQSLRMNAGETQVVALDGGVTMTKWDDSVVEVQNLDGGVRVHAVRAGAAVVTGVDERGVAVDVRVQVFPPLK